MSMPGGDGLRGIEGFLKFDGEFFGGHGWSVVDCGPLFRSKHATGKTWAATLDLRSLGRDLKPFPVSR
jgi:hypothetical protein